MITINMLPHKQATEHSYQDANPMQFGPDDGTAIPHDIQAFYGNDENVQAQEIPFDLNDDTELELLGNGGHTLPAVDGTGSSSSCDAGVADDNPVPTDPHGGPESHDFGPLDIEEISYIYYLSDDFDMMLHQQLKENDSNPAPVTTNFPPTLDTNESNKENPGGSTMGISSPAGSMSQYSQNPGVTSQNSSVAGMTSQVFQDPVVNTAQNSSIAGMTSQVFQDPGVGGMMPLPQPSINPNVSSTDPLSLQFKGGNAIRSQPGLPFSQTSSSSPTRQMLDANINNAERRRGPTEMNFVGQESRGFPETQPTDEPLDAAKIYPVYSVSSSTNSNPAFVQTIETKRIDADGGTQIGHAPQGLTLALLKPNVAEDQGGLDTINQRYEEKKLRNKLAARKSRKKKKEISDKEFKINKELNTIHEQFKVDVKILEDQCRTLRECLDTEMKDNNNWSVPSDNVLDTDDILDYALSLEEELNNIIIDQTTTTGPTNVPTDTDGIGQSAIGIAHSAWTVDGNTDGDGEEEENELMEFLGKRQ